MTLYLHDQDIKYRSKQEGLAEGRQEGLAEGRQEGRQDMNQLIKILIRENRLDDLEKSANDLEYQKKLMKEFGIE